MTEYSREFNEARKAQGFRDQAQLDAFYAHFDHVQACLEDAQGGCHGGHVLLDDGWQGVVVECAEGQRLYQASLAA
jgi:hypothetical protein